jgi:hypothetical protein
VRPDRDRPIEAEGRTVLKRDLHAATRSSLPSSGSDRTCTARRCRRPNRRPAWE